MNPNQPHPPFQPSDDNVVHFNLDHDSSIASATPHEPSLTGSNNFVDETETGLFDFDLEDLENLFNTPPQANGAFDTLASAENEKIATPTAIDLNEHSIMLDKVDLHKVDTVENLSLDPSPSADVPHTFEKIDTSDNLDINDTVGNFHTEIPPAIHNSHSNQTSHNPADMTADFPVNPAILASMNAPTLEKSPTATPEPMVAPTSDSVTTHNSSTTADTAMLATAMGTTATVATLATKASDSTASAKKGLLSSFGNKKTKPTPATPPTPVAIPTAPQVPVTPVTPIIVAKKPAKNNKALLILLGLLLLGALAWLTSQFFAEPEPAPPPAPKVTPVAQAPDTVASPIANSAVVATSPPAQASSATAPITNSATAQSATQTTTPNPTTKNLIKPEEILSAPLPKDNAIAKEELDRLADQSKQLSQQEKMMQEQLKMMNELADKKEERIAILEKQIAQVQAQKSQPKQ